MAKRYQISPKPTDLLPPAPEGMVWESAFFEINEYTTVVEFSGNRYAYKLVEDAKGNENTASHL